ncbi:hypothetical protein Hypma_015958 [Hypsizygus marmoreus]|uniref:Transmembrane protein n=1 Tax=Hypsizygus marmoreus TaxID=39966 RepID=A0A369K3A7_HYPMA|nr:hypothetical protein Hypma_015958 [Hypsizygus marmoreus]
MVLWNFTIDDASPFLSYSPTVDSPTLTNGWRTWYTISQYNNASDELSRGDSFHITSSRDSSVTFQFYGTGVSLFGSTNSSFDVTIDNGPNVSTNMNASTSTLLYSNGSLINGLHSVTLSAQPSFIPNTSQSLALDFAVVSTPLDSDENPPSPLFYDASNTATLVYSGVWTSGVQKGVPNATVSAPFQVTTENGATASLSFTGGNAVAVKGLLGSANGIYSVTMDGSTNTFNGSSSWIIPDALLYFRAGLDPKMTHQINITNFSDNSRLCLNSITVFKHEPRNGSSPVPDSHPVVAKPPSSINLGVILGPVLGLVFVCLVGGALIWYRRRRQTMPGPKMFFKKPSTPPPSPPFIEAPRAAARDTSSSFSANPRYPSSGSETHSGINLLGSHSSRVSAQSSTHSRNEAGSSLHTRATTRSTHRERYLSASPTIMTNASTAYTTDTSSSSELDTTSFHHNLFQPPVFRLPHPLASSSSVAGSSQHTPPPPNFRFAAPEYIPLSPRKPLPIIPVPSYDAALQTPVFQPLEIMDMQLGEDTGFGPPLSAPPQYER